METSKIKSLLIPAFSPKERRSFILSPQRGED
jgi:hypothetical protein